MANSGRYTPEYKAFQSCTSDMINTVENDSSIIDELFEKGIISKKTYDKKKARKIVSSVRDKIELDVKNFMVFSNILDKTEFRSDLNTKLKEKLEEIHIVATPSEIRSTQNTYNLWFVLRNFLILPCVCVILGICTACLFNHTRPEIGIDQSLDKLRPEIRINQTLRDYYKSLEEIDFEQYLPNNMKPNQIPFIVPKIRFGDQSQVETALSVKQLLEEIKSGTRIAITGRPGVGKSTLARYIAKLWANGESLQQFTTLFHICLGRASEAITDLKQIVENECHDIIDLKGSEQEVIQLLKEIQHSQGDNVLFLLDGFDEYYPNHAKENNKIIKLLKGNFLSNSTVIVMSRPRSVENYKHFLKTVFELTGFRTSDIEIYLSHLEASLRTSIENYFENNPNVKNLCCLPLHMTMIIYLASLKENSLSKLDSETKVFKNFLHLTVRHYQERHNLDVLKLDNCFEHPSLANKTSLCSLFVSICELAFNATLHHQQTFTSNEIQLSTNNLQKLSLFNIKKENWRSGPVDVFSFSHQTFRDFMSAYHLVLLPIADQQGMIERYANKSTFRDSVWKFYFGLLGEQNDPALHSLFQSYVKYGGYKLLPTKYYEIDLYPLAYALETGVQHDEFIELLEYTNIVGKGNNYSLQLNVEEAIDVLSFLNIEENNVNANVNFLFMKHTLKWTVIRFVKIQLRIKCNSNPDPNVCSNFFWVQLNAALQHNDKISVINRYCNKSHRSATSYVAVLELEYFHPMKEAVDPHLVYNMLKSAIQKNFEFAVDIKTQMIEYLNTNQSSLRRDELLERINHTNYSLENLTGEELNFMHLWNFFGKYEKISNEQYSLGFSELKRLKLQRLIHNQVDFENLCLFLKSATKLEVLDLSHNHNLEQTPTFLDLFQSLPHLKVLDLSYTDIDLDWLAKGFKNLSTLQELYVSEGNVYSHKLFGAEEHPILQNDKFEIQLTHLKKLEVLDLSHVILNIPSFAHKLKNFKNLKRLILSDCIYCTGFRECFIKPIKLDYSYH